MKKLIALLLVMVMVLGMVACGAKTETPVATETPAKTEEPKKEEPKKEEEKEEPKKEEEKKEDVTIEVWIAQADWADAWDVMEERFEEQYPWIDLEHVGLGEANFLTTRLAAKDLPTVIQCNNNPTLDSLFEGGYLTDLTDWPCAQYMPETYKQAFTKEGKLIGMCQGAAFSCMFFNMAILEQAGWTEAPKTWDELLECCADVQALGIAPLVTAAGKTTTSWMILELVLANSLNDADAVAAYQEDFKNGTFDWAAVPGLAEKMDAIAPYWLTGTATASEQDAATYMTDGLAAMCLAGNWNAGILTEAITTAAGDPSKVYASLPPFGTEEVTWISNSPEDAFCVTVDANRTPAEQEAVELFFNWVFEAENFALIQNARGTVPVTTNMTAEYTVLADCMLPVAEVMGSAPAVLMGFNLWAAEFRDAACSMIKGLVSGDNDAAALVAKMAEMMPKSYKNQG